MLQFFCFTTTARDPWLDPLRTDPRFPRILRTTESRHREAAAACFRAEGDRVLGHWVNGRPQFQVATASASTGPSATPTVLLIP